MRRAKGRLLDYDPDNPHAWLSNRLPSPGTVGERSLDTDKGSRTPRQQSNTPRHVAVMSNAVQSIGHRQEKKSLIRHREPKVVFVAPTLNALRLLLWLIFHVRAKKDCGFEQYNFSVPDLGRNIGLTYRMTREQAETLLQDLSSVVFTYRDIDTFATAPVMEICMLDHTTSAVRLRLNEAIAQYLLELRNHYRQLHPVVLKLRSPYSMLLYIHLRRYVGLKRRRHRVALTDLLMAMQMKNRPWAAFHKDYLKPAIEEINRETEISVTYEPERGGRTDRKRGNVDALMFDVVERKQAAGVHREEEEQADDSTP